MKLNKVFYSSWLILRQNLFFYSSFVVFVQLISRVWLFVTPWTVGFQAPYPSLSLRACSNSCPLSWWCHPTISSSVAPFSSCPQSFPVSGSFTVSQLFASGGQSIGVSASISVLPINTQDWSPLGWTGWTSLQSKGLSRVFSNTTVQKHQFFTSVGHSIGASASATVLPMNIQDWFPLGLTGLISSLSKGLSRVFYRTTVQKHQFFCTQLSL